MARKLGEYHRKRDFNRTPEPSGRTGTRSATGPPDEPGFVIQHHLATSDHYDFRLEVDGVLKSWAVPKGPSPDPAQKRLAVPTEDHPLDYADFEGTIGEGEYGGGTVMVWDTGSYRNTTEHKGEALAMSDGLDRGHVTFSLAGTKLGGEYALTRTRTSPKAQWILVKMRDADASARRDPVKSATKSALSGRTMHQIETDARGTETDTNQAETDTNRAETDAHRAETDTKRAETGDDR